MRSRRSLRTLSVALLICFVLQDLALAQGGASPAWPTYKTAPRSSQRDAASLRKPQVPRSLGATRGAYLTDSDRTLIQIEDAHDSMDAQEKITSILDVLASDYDVRTIAVEGGSSPFDATLFRTYPDPQGARNAARALMEKGRLNAGEFFAATSGKDLEVYGAEEETLYRANLKSFRDLLRNRERLEPTLAGVDKTLEMLAERVYSEPVKAVSMNGALRADGGPGFTAKWSILKGLASERGVAVSAYPQLTQLDRVTAMEEGIDFQAANSERERLLEAFRTLLTGRDLEQVLLRSLSFKAGKTPESEFHLFLTDLAHRQGLDPSSYPDLARYTEYLVLFDTIDLTSVIEELESFERALLDASVTGADEKELVAIQRDWAALSAVLRGSATSDEYHALTGEARVRSRTLAGRLAALAERHRVPLFGGGPRPELFAALPAALRFYRLAERRNEALVGNTLRRMRQNDAKAAALVTGGFHSEGISQLLRQRRLSHLVILPRITDPNKKRPYLVILTRKPAEVARSLSSGTGRYQIAIRSVFTAGRNDPLATDAELGEVLRPFVEELRKDADAEQKAVDWMDAYATQYALEGGVSNALRPERIRGILHRITGYARLGTGTVADGARLAGREDLDRIIRSLTTGGETQRREAVAAVERWAKAPGSSGDHLPDSAQASALVDALAALDAGGLSAAVQSALATLIGGNALSRRNTALRDRFYAPAAARVKVISLGQVWDHAGQIPEGRESFKVLVDPPLVEASALLFDKGIGTFTSSANSRDQYGVAYIGVDEGSLTSENRALLDTLADEGLYDADKNHLIFKFDPETTVEELDRRAVSTVGRFHDQSVRFKVGDAVDDPYLRYGRGLVQSVDGRKVTVTFPLRAEPEVFDVSLLAGARLAQSDFSQRGGRVHAVHRRLRDEMLVPYLTEAGIAEADAEIVANTLVRARQELLDYYRDTGLLTAEEATILGETFETKTLDEGQLTLDRLDRLSLQDDALAARIRERLAGYAGYPEGQRKDLVERLVPVEDIRGWIDEGIPEWVVFAALRNRFNLVRDMPDAVSFVEAHAERTGGPAIAWQYILSYGLEEGERLFDASETWVRTHSGLMGGTVNAWKFLLAHNLQTADRVLAASRVWVEAHQGRVGGPANAWQIVLSYGIKGAGAFLKKAERWVASHSAQVGGPANAWRIYTRQGARGADAFVADGRAWVETNHAAVRGRRNAWSILAAHGLDGADAAVIAGTAWVGAHQTEVGGQRNAWDIFIKQGAGSATVWVDAHRAAAQGRIDAGASAARAWFVEITNLTQLTGARLSALTERKSGHVVVLDRSGAAPVMRVLPVVRASDLTRRERAAAFERFYDWFDQEDLPGVTHAGDIEYYLSALENNDPDVLTRLFLVWSDGAIEGYADLGSEGRDFSGIEIAPWNRRALGEEARYGGIGAELRMFAIRRLESEWGAEVLYGPKIHHVVTLGHRDSGGDVFDYATVDQAAVRAEMSRQAQVRKRLVREHGYTRVEPSGARLADGHRNIYYAVNLSDLGVEYDGKRVTTRRGLDKLRRMLPQLREAGFRKVYLYGGLYQPSPLSVQVHQVEHDGEHFLTSGSAMVRVAGYRTRRDDADGIELRDSFGNPFSIQGMHRLNRDLSSRRTHDTFTALVSEAEALGIGIVADYIAWTSPDAVDGGNYKRYFWRPVPGENTERFTRRGEADKKRLFRRLLSSDRSASFLVRAQEGGAERPVFVKHLAFFGSHSADQAIPNALHPEVQREMIDSYKRLIDLGVREFRVDLGHLLLKKHLRGYYEDQRAQGIDLMAWLAESGIPTRPGEDFGAWWVRQEEPWRNVISAARAYAYEKHGEPIRIYMETYDPADQEELLFLGADATYFGELFEAFYRVVNEGAPAHLLEAALLRAFALRARIITYLTNFDQIALRMIGDAPEAAAMIVAMLSRWGVKVILDSRDHAYLKGQISTIPGGTANRRDKHTHSRGDRQELEARADLDAYQRRLTVDAPLAQVLADFERTVPGQGENYVTFLNNSNRDRYLTPAWRTETGQWVIALIDFRPSQKKSFVKVELPGDKAGFEAQDFRAVDASTGRAYEITAWEPDREGSPATVDVRFEPDESGLRYRIVRLDPRSGARLAPVEGARSSVTGERELSVAIRWPELLSDLVTERSRLSGTPIALTNEIGPGVTTLFPRFTEDPGILRSAHRVRSAVRTLIRLAAARADAEVSVELKRIDDMKRVVIRTSDPEAFDSFYQRLDVEKGVLARAGIYVSALYRRYGAGGRASVEMWLDVPDRPGIRIAEWWGQRQIDRLGKRFAQGLDRNAQTMAANMYVFDFAELKTETGRDLAGKEVLYIGPYKNAADLLELIRTYPRMKAVHLVEIDADAFRSLDQQLRTSGVPLPRIYGYRSSVLDLPWHLKGRIAMAFDKYVFADSWFGPGHLERSGREIQRVLEEGGLHVTAGPVHQFPQGAIASGMNVLRPDNGHFTVFIKDAQGARLAQQRLHTAEELTRAGEVMSAVAREMGDEAVRLRQAGLQVEIKSDGSPVTNADKELQLRIIRRLMAMLPEVFRFGLVAEESLEEIGLDADEIERLRSVQDAPYRLVIDPIDGTRSYVNGSDEFGVALALVRADSDSGQALPVAAVFYAPDYSVDGQKGALFYADENRPGVYLNGASEPVRIADLPAEEGRTVFIHKDLGTASVRTGGFRVKDERYSSSMEQSLIAWGRPGTPVAYARHAGVKWWDFFIGYYFILKTGGQMRSLEGDAISVRMQDLDRTDHMDRAFVTGQTWAVERLLGRGARLAVSPAALGRTAEDELYADRYEALTRRFESAEGVPLEWSSPLGPVQASIRYDGLFDVFVVRPSEATRKSYPSLDILDLPASQEDIGERGSFGNIRIKLRQVDGELSAIVDEIHPSRGYRKLGPSAVRRAFRPWAERAIEELASQLVRSSNIERLYASTPERIDGRYRAQRIQKANLWESYRYPFAHKGWAPAIVDLPGEPSARLWLRKPDGARLADQRLLDRLAVESSIFERMELTQQLGWDLRPVEAALLDGLYVGHDLEVKKVVNPDDRPLVAVYGGAGSDISNFLLSTNATESYFVDHAGLLPESWLLALRQGSALTDSFSWLEYQTSKYSHGHAVTGRTGLDAPEAMILMELASIGVDLSRMEDVIDEGDGSFTIRFPWSYPGQRERLYRITFVKADITDPSTYPARLRRLLDRGIDLYYQRAGMLIPARYGDFLLTIARAVRPGGHLVTDDVLFNGYGYRFTDPGPLVAALGFRAGSDLNPPSLLKIADAVAESRKRVLGAHVNSPFELRYGFDVTIRRREVSGKVVSGARLSEYAGPLSSQRIPGIVRYGFQTAVAAEDETRRAVLRLLDERITAAPSDIPALRGALDKLAGLDWEVFPLTVTSVEHVTQRGGATDLLAVYEREGREGPRLGVAQEVFYGLPPALTAELLLRQVAAESIDTDALRRLFPENYPSRSGKGELWSRIEALAKKRVVPLGVETLLKRIEDFEIGIEKGTLKVDDRFPALVSSFARDVESLGTTSRYLRETVVQPFKKKVAGKRGGPEMSDVYWALRGIGIFDAVMRDEIAGMRRDLFDADFASLAARYEKLPLYMRMQLGERDEGPEIYDRWFLKESEAYNDETREFLESLTEHVAWLEERVRSSIQALPNLSPAQLKAASQDGTPQTLGGLRRAAVAIEDLTDIRGSLEPVSKIDGYRELVGDLDAALERSRLLERTVRESVTLKMGARLSWQRIKGLFNRFSDYLDYYRTLAVYAFTARPGDRLRLRYIGHSPFNDDITNAILFFGRNNRYAVGINRTDETSYELLRLHQDQDVLTAEFADGYDLISEIYPEIHFEPYWSRYMQGESQIRRLDKFILLDGSQQYKTRYHEVFPVPIESVRQQVATLERSASSDPASVLELSRLREKERLYTASAENIQALLEDRRIFTEEESVRIRRDLIVLGVYTETQLIIPTLSVEYQFGLLRKSPARPLAYIPIRHYAGLDRLSFSERWLAGRVLLYALDQYERRQAYRKAGLIPETIHNRLREFDRQWRRSVPWRVRIDFFFRHLAIYMRDVITMARLRRTLRSEIKVFLKDLDDVRIPDLRPAGLSQTALIRERERSVDHFVRHDYDMRVRIVDLEKRADDLASRARALGDPHLALQVHRAANRLQSDLGVVDSGLIVMDRYVNFLKTLIRHGQFNEFTKALYDLRRGLLPLARGYKVALEPSEKSLFLTLAGTHQFREWMIEMFDRQRVMNRAINRRTVVLAEAEAVRLYDDVVYRFEQARSGARLASPDPASAARLLQARDYFSEQVIRLLAQLNEVPASGSVDPDRLERARAQLRGLADLLVRMEGAVASDDTESAFAAIWQAWTVAVRLRSPDWSSLLEGFEGPADRFWRELTLFIESYARTRLDQDRRAALLAVLAAADAHHSSVLVRHYLATNPELDGVQGRLREALERYRGLLGRLNQSGSVLSDSDGEIQQLGGRIRGMAEEVRSLDRLGRPVRDRISGTLEASALRLDQLTELGRVPPQSVGARLAAPEEADRALVDALGELGELRGFLALNLERPVIVEGHDLRASVLTPEQIVRRIDESIASIAGRPLREPEARRAVLSTVDLLNELLYALRPLPGAAALRSEIARTVRSLAPLLGEEDEPAVPRSLLGQTAERLSTLEDLHEALRQAVEVEDPSGEGEASRLMLSLATTVQYLRWASGDPLHRLRPVLRSALRSTSAALHPELAVFYGPGTSRALRRIDKLLREVATDLEPWIDRFGDVTAEDLRYARQALTKLQISQDMVRRLRLQLSEPAERELNGLMLGLGSAVRRSGGLRDYAAELYRDRDRIESLVQHIAERLQVHPAAGNIPHDVRVLLVGETGDSLRSVIDDLERVAFGGSGARLAGLDRPRARAMIGRIREGLERYERRYTEEPESRVYPVTHRELFAATGVGHETFFRYVTAGSELEAIVDRIRALAETHRADTEARRADERPKVSAVLAGLRAVLEMARTSPESLPDELTNRWFHERTGVAKQTFRHITRSGTTAADLVRQIRELHRAQRDERYAARARQDLRDRRADVREALESLAEANADPSVQARILDIETIATAAGYDRHLTGRLVRGSASLRRLYQRHRMDRYDSAVLNAVRDLSAVNRRAQDGQNGHVEFTVAAIATAAGLDQATVWSRLRGDDRIRSEFFGALRQLAGSSAELVEVPGPEATTPATVRPFELSATEARLLTAARRQWEEQLAASQPRTVTVESVALEAGLKEKTGFGRYRRIGPYFRVLSDRYLLAPRTVTVLRGLQSLLRTPPAITERSGEWFGASVAARSGVALTAVQAEIGRPGLAEYAVAVRRSIESVAPRLELPEALATGRLDASHQEELVRLLSAYHGNTEIVARLIDGRLGWRDLLVLRDHPILKRHLDANRERNERYWLEQLPALSGLIPLFEEAAEGGRVGFADLYNAAYDRGERPYPVDLGIVSLWTSKVRALSPYDHSGAAGAGRVPLAVAPVEESVTEEDAGARLADRAEGPSIVVGVRDAAAHAVVTEALGGRVGGTARVLTLPEGLRDTEALALLEGTGAQLALFYEGQDDLNRDAKADLLRALSGYLQQADRTAYPVLARLLSGELELSQVPVAERAGIEKLIFSLLPVIRPVRIEDRLAEQGEEALLELQLRLFHPSTGYTLDHLSGWTEPKAAVWSLETIAADPFFFRMLDDRDRKIAGRMPIVDYAAVPSGVDVSSVLGERYAEFTARFGAERVLTDSGSLESVSASLSTAASKEFGTVFTRERTLFIETERDAAGRRTAVQGRDIPYLVVRGRIAPILDKVVVEILDKAGSDQPLLVRGLTKVGDLYIYIPIVPVDFTKHFRRYYQMVRQVGAAA